MPSLTLKQAAKISGYTPQYIRQLIREGKLTSTLRPLVEGGVTKRHEIESEDLDDYLAFGAIKSKREDKRYKFVFYARPDEYESIVEVVREAGFVEVADLMVPASNNKAMRYIHEPGTDAGGRFLD